MSLSSEPVGCFDNADDDGDACLLESGNDVGLIRESSTNSKRISFPVDSILNAVIQESDIMELFRILRHQRSEIDLNQTNHTGLTALHYAVLTNNQDTVKLLLNHGADVCAQDMYGFSPLHTAAALGFLHVTSMLIMFGADIFSLTKQSEYPIDVAKDIAVVRILSNEMYLRAHSEVYFRAMLRLQVTHIFRRVCSLMCYLYTILLTFGNWIRRWWITYRSTTTATTAEQSDSTTVIEQSNTDTRQVINENNVNKDSAGLSNVVLHQRKKTS